MRPRDESSAPERSDFVRRAVFNRLAAARGPMTEESIAAVMNVDLTLARAVLAALVATGSIVREGILFSLPRTAA